MRLVRSISLLVLAAGCGGLLACGPVHSVTVGRDRPPHSEPPIAREGNGHGPPPWAPAHGYRKHQRAYQHRANTVDMVFDSGLGVYVVVGIPNYYYWNGTYIRLNAGSWYRAPYLDARWVACAADDLPGNLRSKSAKHGRGKGKGKGHGAAKRSD